MNICFKRISNIIVFMLTCFFLFSVCFVTTNANHDCTTDTCVECVEIHNMQEALDAKFSKHGECDILSCAVCEEIAQDTQILETIYASHEDCMKGDCSICYQIEAYMERIKSTLFFAIVFLLFSATIYVVHLITIHKTERTAPVSLILLKVKLTA